MVEQQGASVEKLVEKLTIREQEIVRLQQQIAEFKLSESKSDVHTYDQGEHSESTCSEYNNLRIEVVKLRDRVADLKVEKAKALAKYTQEKESIIASLEAEIARLKGDLEGKREVVALKERLVRRDAEIMSLTRQLNAKLSSSPLPPHTREPAVHTAAATTAAAASRTATTHEHDVSVRSSMT